VAILHAIMDRVLDDYAPVVAGVENDIDEMSNDQNEEVKRMSAWAAVLLVHRHPPVGQAGHRLPR
jgi:Mg2+ and Co2+ transporter CorA